MAEMADVIDGLGRALIDNNDGTRTMRTNATLTTGDIEIGAVELKDGATDTRAKVKTDGTDNAVVVMQNTQPLPTGAATAAKQPALGTAGTASADVLTVQGIASMTAIKVDGSAVTQPVSAASLPLPSGASTAAKQPALGTAGTPSADVISVQGVTSMTPLKVDGSGVTQPVSGTVSANATLAAETTKVIGTVNVAASQTIAVTQATASSLNAQVVGEVAHDAVDSGNPQKMGLHAKSALSGATLVAADDRTDAMGDLDGAMIVRSQVPLGDILAERVSNTDGASTAFTTFDNAAGKRNYITTIAIFNASATDGYVDFRDGTAGSIIFSAPAPKGGGSVITFPVPLRQPTAATALAYDVSGALTTVYISIVGFKSKA